MTKRRLFIVIAILLTIDAAVGLLYLATHVNTDGKGISWLNFDDDDIVLAQADTIADHLPNDEFQDIYKFVACVSRQPQTVGNSRDYITCLKRVLFKWPTRIGGKTRLDDLNKALLEKLFDKGYGSVDMALTAEMANPEGLLRAEGGWQQLNRLPQVIQKPQFGHENSFKVYPHLSSDRWVEFKIVRTTFDGNHAQSIVRFLLYDRQRGQVMRFNDIINPAKADEVLSIVNERINQLVTENKRKLSHANHLPVEIDVQPEGIDFIFPPGIIGDSTEGIVEIDVPYNVITPCLTDNFKMQLSANGNYVHHKPIFFDKIQQ